LECCGKQPSFELLSLAPTNRMYFSARKESTLCKYRVHGYNLFLATSAAAVVPIRRVRPPTLTAAARSSSVMRSFNLRPSATAFPFSPRNLEVLQVRDFACLPACLPLPHAHTHAESESVRRKRLIAAPDRLSTAGKTMRPTAAQRRGYVGIPEHGGVEGGRLLRGDMLRHDLAASGGSRQAYRYVCSGDRRRG